MTKAMFLTLGQSQSSHLKKKFTNDLNKSTAMETIEKSSPSGADIACIPSILIKTSQFFFLVKAV